MRLSRIVRLHLVALLALAFTVFPPLSAASLPAGLSSSALGLPGLPPVLNARSAVIMDATTGTIVFAKNPDLVIPPASLTKLITLHIVYEEIAAGRLSRDELVTIDKRDCSPYIPYGSSLMYLRPGMHVSILDLMRGAAVVSGNDAAFALARRISGSNEAFAARMNEEVQKMGFTKMLFVEPSGLSELNRITAREYALFCKRYLELHPEAIGELHSLRYIEFPRPEHATADYTPHGRIIQYNRNSLVLDYPGCDGLKTGYIVEAGYNLAATALRNGTRFIIVTLGGSGEGSAGGGTGQRSHDGAALLDWAFSSYQTIRPPVTTPKNLRAWYGSRSRLGLEPASALAVTVPKTDAGRVETSVRCPDYVDAPIAQGQSVGEVVYSVDGTVLHRVELVAAERIDRGNFFIVLRDAVEKFFSRLFGISPSA
ncbi:MAG TPA: D-alanyl-D-alanine carboxypeptidase family protein [Rectinemataceae bacterium]|nr:D-alanyl-D-alanine carboxypeptidase family protein [Rectinemataceae bacterium]